MRLTTLCLLPLLAAAGCASDPAGTLAGPRNVGTVAPRTGGARMAAGSITLTTEGTTRPHTVLEVVTTTERQITIFGKVPTRADVDESLRRRAAELDADAVINVRYGSQGAGLVSYSQISAEGQAIRYTGR